MRKGRQYCFDIRFWIHHEGQEGQFRWEGDRNLRYFVEMCAKHTLYVIVRVGPFVHGECRNGGFPDWLEGRPFELRGMTLLPALCVSLYGEIGRAGTWPLDQDGGPIVAIQLENEFMHTGAPREVAPRLARSGSLWALAAPTTAHTQAAGPRG